MPGYVYVWQQAMLRNAKRREGFEPPVIVRARGEVYGVRITGGSEIVYTPPDRFKTKDDTARRYIDKLRLCDDFTVGLDKTLALRF